MSQFTKCIDGLQDAQGILTVYGCDDEKIRCLRSTTDSTYTLKLSLPNKTVNDGAAVAAVFEPPCEARPDGTRHVFFTQRSGTLGHVVDPGGKSDQSIGTVHGGPRGLTGVFGAVAHAAGVILLGFSSPGSQTLYWIFSSWDDLAAGRFGAAKTWSLGLGNQLESTHLSTSQSEVRLALVSDASGEQRVVAFDTVQGKSKWHVYGQSIGLNADGSPRSSMTALSLSQSTDDRPWSLQVMQQPWGEVYATWMLDDDPVQFSVAVAGTIDHTVNETTSPFPSQTEDGHATYSGWLYGDVSQSASTANPHAYDAELALQGITACVHGSSYTGRIAKTPTGYLRRRALSTQPAAKLNVVGIIAGPPPVPKENLDMPTRYDGFSPNLVPADGSTQYATQISASSTLDINWGVAFFGQWKERTEASESVSVFGITLVDAEAYEEASFKLSLGYQGLYENVTRRTTATDFQCMIKMQGPTPTADEPGDYEVEPLGALIVAHTTWTGYTYEYLDDSREVPDGSLSFSTLFPDSVELDTLPFVLNPDTYCTPGDLLSYQRTQSELNAFNAAATPLANDATRLVNAWSVNSSMSSQSLAFAQSTWTNGFTLDTEAMLTLGGQGGILGLGGKTSYTVGGSATFGVKYAQSSDNSIGISSQMQTRGNLDAPNTYSHYQWFTYQLEPSGEWLNDLLGSLVTDTFPEPDSNQHRINQELKDRIDPDSTPWLITYALGEYTYLD